MDTSKESRNILLLLAKNLSRVYIIQNSRLFVSRSKINEYVVFMSVELNDLLNVAENKNKQVDCSSFDDDINLNHEVDCQSINELLISDAVLENVESFDKKSIDNLVSNLSKSLYKSYNEKVSSYLQYLLHDCLSDDFDIEDEDEIQAVCYRVANRLRDYQYEEY